MNRFDEARVGKPDERPRKDAIRQRRQEKYQREAKGRMTEMEVQMESTNERKGCSSKWSYYSVAVTPKQ